MELIDDFAIVDPAHMQAAIEITTMNHYDFIQDRSRRIREGLITISEAVNEYCTRYGTFMVPVAFNAAHAARCREVSK